MPVPSSIDDLDPVATDNSPAGSEQVFPNLDNYLRAHAAFIAQVRDLVRDAAPAIGMTQWWGGNRSFIPAKHQPQDGQMVNRSDYPALWALISSGALPLITETSWWANPALRGSFSSGNGSSTFRFPDLNGKQSNSIGSVVLRGDGEYSTGTPGGMQDSQNLLHRHAVTVGDSGSHAHSVSGSTDEVPDHAHANADGAYLVALAGGGWTGRAAGFNSGSTGSAGRHAHTVSGATSNAPAHNHATEVSDNGGNEARMKSVTGVWVIRAI